MNKAIIAVLAVIVIAAGGYFVLHNKSSSTTSNSSPSAASSTAASSTPSSTQTAAVATITYSGTGFSPSTTTVKSGDTVAIKNSSLQDMQMESNPHPLHTDDSDLNVGTVGSNQTVTFTVTKKGTFGFHNHLNPSDTGTITIE